MSPRPHRPTKKANEALQTKPNTDDDPKGKFVVFASYFYSGSLLFVVIVQCTVYNKEGLELGIGLRASFSFFLGIWGLANTSTRIWYQRM